MEYPIRYNRARTYNVYIRYRNCEAVDDIATALQREFR
jgi:hypothetical protein